MKYLSHELRTPLTAIKGWTITLNSSETDKETLKLGFEIIEKETDRLTLMVEELLDFSRLINDKVTLEKKQFNIKDLISHIESFMIPRAKKENIALVIKNNVDEFIYADVNRMKQVFINILDNAFKFNKPGGRVEFDVYKIEDKIKFVINDDGSGISKEDLPKIKEKFFKGKSSKSQNGIGLSICDEIIQLHNGEFNIYSELGIGTKVEVIIPITKEE